MRAPLKLKKIARDYHAQVTGTARDGGHTLIIIDSQAGRQIPAMLRAIEAEYPEAEWVREAGSRSHITRLTLPWRAKGTA